MREKNEEPMPLSELPEYLRSARESGQGDYVPVVDVGRIVDDRRRWPRRFAYAGVLCALLLLGFAYSTKEITIVSGESLPGISEMVQDDGGRVISAFREEDGSYRVRVFSLGFKDLMDRLRERKELEKVEME